MTERHPTIALFLGDETVGRTRAVDELVAAVFGDGPSSFNLATFTAVDGAERAVEVAKTVPMMAKHRVVVIRGMESAPTDLLDDLLRYAERPCPSTVMILSGVKNAPAVGGVDRGRKLEAAVKKVGVVKRFKTADQNPRRFAIATAEEAGMRLEPAAADLVVELVGTDLGRLQAEMNKVIAFVGGEGSIGTADVEAVCSLVAEAVIWDLTDAVVRRDPDRAMVAAHRMLETGEATHRLMAMIAWQMRQLITIQECMQTRTNPADVGVRMPRRKLTSAQDALRRRPLDPARLLGRLAEANGELNRSRAGDRRIFEGLLLELVAT
ncbi:MAG: DNA polymerase III subunit delta [Myxococcota bacterium]|nr:DNA polymerase III subunit delta [Myxococcota bacterium]